jgi:hypothetical protein
MSGPHDPRTWTWPLTGTPDSLANTPRVEYDFLECPHKHDRRCEYRVRIAVNAFEFTLKEHLAKSCPLRTDPEYVLPDGYQLGSGLA